MIKAPPEEESAVFRVLPLFSNDVSIGGSSIMASCIEGIHQAFWFEHIHIRPEKPATKRYNLVIRESPY